MPSRNPKSDEDFGEPIKFDPDFRGPMYKRSCTDCLCLLLFVGFLVGWGVVSVYAISRGDVRRLLVPTDSDGLKCGLDSVVIDKPYLVFFDLTKCLSPTVPINGCPTPQVCVQTCPSVTILKVVLEHDSKPIDIIEMRKNLVCKYTVNKTTQINSKADILELMNKGECASNVFESTPILGRCFGDLTPLLCGSDKPTSSKQVSPPILFHSARKGNLKISQPSNLIKKDYSCDLEAMKKFKGIEKLKSRITVLDTYLGLTIAASLSYFTDDKSTKEMGTMIIEDLVNARWWMVVALIVVMIVCLLYIAIMRWIAAPVVWFSIFGVVGILSYSIYLSYNRYAYLKANPILLQESQTNLKAVVNSVFSLEQTWLVILIAACLTLAIILLSVLFLRKRIVIAIALIKEGSKAVSSVMSTLIFPIFPWIMQCLILCLAIVVGVYLSSIGESNYVAVGLNETGCVCKYKERDPCIPQIFNLDCGHCKDAICHFISVTSPMYIKALLAVDIVGFFWCIFFLEGLGEMILASTFATWYWTFKKSNVPFFTLTNSVVRTFRYHLGTVAFGSLIITICRLIRVALEFIHHKISKYDNVFTRAVMCCCRCFFYCLETFLKFINKNAYIMCAIHGKSFCPSARDAFSLLMRNILHVVVLDKVTDFLFFLSKIIISIGCGIAAYFAFTSPDLYRFTGDQQLHYDMVPPLIIGIAAFLIASIFFSVYSMAVDTLFLCFLEDCERNDGSREKPYFMSKELMRILNKNNRIN